MKTVYSVAVDAEMATNITKAHERFKAAKRKVSRNDVIVQLLDDGLSVWRREVDPGAQMAETVARLSEQIARQDRMLRSILLTLAEGDEEEYRDVMSKIEAQEKADG
jgi:hypothetical protein